ncbi:MAG: MBL fold metallo-hydrolase, partial [Muribaculaceae bacterium]|nr:MBL fold metallo-hydrolase [Muribaculaceae bacterium]
MAKKKNFSEQFDSPGLFDDMDFGLDIDFASDEIAGRVIEEHTSYVARSADVQSLEINPTNLSKRSALKFISFGSGSSGNCAYLGNSEYGILIDAGVDPEKVYKTLKDNKIDLKTIAGIILTHDHADHVKYAYNILRTHRWMVLYATPRTMSGLLRRHSISRRIKDYHKAIYKEFPFKTADFNITPFETSHDGTDNVGYFI